MLYFVHAGKNKIKQNKTKQKQKQNKNKHLWVILHIVTVVMAFILFFNLFILIGG